MKNFWLGTSVLALLLTGCSQNEVIELRDGTDPNAISFDVTTSKPGTRADDSNVSTLQAKGFKVFATHTKDNVVATYINNKPYKYENSNWIWDLPAGDIPKWSGVGFPMNFYAYYPQTMDDLALNNLESYPVTIPAVENQVDMLIAYKKEVLLKPTSGTIPFSFQHLLSKVQFMALSPGGITHVQHVSVNKMYEKGTFSFADFKWGNANNLADYIYRKSPVTPSVAQKAIGPSENAQLIGASNEALMLLPQDATNRSFDPAPANNAAELVDKEAAIATQLQNNANIQMIYRMSTATENIVGYGKATDHPKYTEVDKANWSEPHKAYTGGLYVKVAYGIGNNVWSKGKCYTYVFKLGTTSSGGFLVDDNFYDENGNIFPLPVVRPGEGNPDLINPGDPIFAGSTDIGFTVTVDLWDTTWNGQGDQVPL